MPGVARVAGNRHDQIIAIGFIVIPFNGTADVAHRVQLAEIAVTQSHHTVDKIGLVTIPYVSNHYGICSHQIILLAGGEIRIIKVQIDDGIFLQGQRAGQIQQRHDSRLVSLSYRCQGQ